MRVTQILMHAIMHMSGIAQQRANAFALCHHLFVVKLGSRKGQNGNASGRAGSHMHDP